MGAAALGWGPGGLTGVFRVQTVEAASGTLTVRLYGTAPFAHAQRYPGKEKR